MLTWLERIERLAGYHDPMSRARTRRHRAGGTSPPRTTRGAPDPATQVPVSNAGVATLVAGIHREEGWAGQPAGSMNRGGPQEVTAPGGRTVRRHAVRGIKDSQMKTDMAVVVIPDGLPADGAAVDVLVHLHGFEVWSEAKPDKPSRLLYGTGYEDARARGGAKPIDTGVMQLEQQMSAAGRPLVAILPQGSSKSDFSSGAGKGFDVHTYVGNVFDRLTADGAWQAGPAAPGAKPPRPGAVTLSGHSGADQPIVEMLESGKADDLQGLFLFDTMFVTDAEKKNKPKKGPATSKTWPLQLEGKVEAYLRKRFAADLAAIRAKPAADRRAYVESRGFRLSVVHARGSYRYAEAVESLKAAVDELLAGVDPKDVGADVVEALKRNYRFRPADPGKQHMDVMADGNFTGAITMLPLAAATGVGGGAAKAAEGEPAPDPGLRRMMATIGGGAANRAASSVLTRRPARLQRDDVGDAVDVEAEFRSFSARGAVEGGLDGYKGIRELFIARFGSIATANSYYSKVKTVPFLATPPPTGTPSPAPAPKALTVHVHEALVPHIRRAEQLMRDKGWFVEVAAGVERVGGFNIRRNRNNRDALSDHSFGWAFDVDAALNPNLDDSFPGRALTAATGDSIVTGAMETVAAGGTAEELLVPIDEIRAASDAFKAVFADEASLGAAMREHLVQRLKFRIRDDVPLLDMVRAAAGAGKAGTKARGELAELLKDSWGSIPDAERWLDEADREEIVANKGWKKWKAEKARRDKVEEKEVAAFRKRRGDAAAKWEKLKKKGVTEEELRRQVDEPLQKAEIAAFEAELDRLATRASGVLIEMWKVYAASFERGRTTGSRVGASTEGTPGSVAAHGFMNMPSRLAAALAGSDGGDLDWLGVAGVHDVMHFQLKPGDRPSLT